MAALRPIALGSLLANPVLGGKKVFDITESPYNAVGDGKTDCTEAIQQAFNDAEQYVKSSNGGVEVKFPSPSKSFVFGAVTFNGLHGSTISFAKGAKMETCTGITKHCLDNWEEGSSHHAPWIHGTNSDDLTITAGDKESTVFEGHGDWWNNDDKKKVKPKRPRMMQFDGMKNFKILNFHLKNAPTGHMALHKCDVVEVANLHLDSPIATANTDGLGFTGCTSVHAHDLTVQNGDDSILVGDCRDVLIEKGKIYGGHGLNMGGDTAELSNYNVTFQHLELSGMHRGTRIKIRPDTLGTIEKVYYYDISMTDVEYPMGIQTDYGTKYQTVDSTATTSGSSFVFKDIHWDKITAKNKKGLRLGMGGGGDIKTPGEFRCSHAKGSNGCKDLRFSNINIKPDSEHKTWVCESCGCSASSVSPEFDKCGSSPGPSPSPTPAPAPSGSFKHHKNSHCSPGGGYYSLSDKTFDDCESACANDKKCGCFDTPGKVDEEACDKSTGKHCMCRLYESNEYQSSSAGYDAYTKESVLRLEVV